MSLARQTDIFHRASLPEPLGRAPLPFLGWLCQEAVDFVLPGLRVYRVRLSQDMKGGRGLDLFQFLDPAMPEAIPLPILPSYESVNSCFCQLI